MNKVNELVMDTIKRVLTEQPEEVDINLDGIKEEDNILELGLNSISYIKLIVEIENEFDIEFEDCMLDYTTMESIKDIIDTVNNKLNEATVEV